MMRRIVLMLLVAIAPTASSQASLSPADARAIADTATGFRIVVSREARRLCVIGEGNDTLRVIPVAIGSGRTLTEGRRTWTFETPVGPRTVMARDSAPLWIAPDWYFIEMARQLDLPLAYLDFGKITPLSDGRALAVRHRDVVMLGADSSEVTVAGTELIIEDHTLFVPPLGTNTRSVPGILGRYRISLGEGLGIHGTNEPASVGQSVTHGCLRVSDTNAEWLYRMIPVGTRVFIY